MSNPTLSDLHDENIVEFTLKLQEKRFWYMRDGNNNEKMLGIFDAYTGKIYPTPAVIEKVLEKSLINEKAALLKKVANSLQKKRT